MHIFEEYLTWIKRKFEVNSLKRKYQINEGEVYWCSLGLNVGDEQNGKGEKFRRPVLIIKKFNKNIFLGIPMTTKNKENKYYVKITLKDIPQSAMISQIRIMDVRRLDEKIGYVSKNDFKEIRKQVADMFN